MHPEIAAFPASYFYDGRLQNGVSAKDRTPPTPVFQFPQQAIPIMFIHIEGTEQQMERGTSVYNEAEVQIVGAILRKLSSNHVNGARIGIVTPYAAQRVRIYEEIESTVKRKAKRPMVASVESFQGAERDYIIISCVRSNDEQNIGFLTDPRRLNVSITRARMGLIIVGNANALSCRKMWKDYLESLNGKGLIVAGGFEQPQPFTFREPKPPPETEDGTEPQTKKKSRNQRRPRRT
jgi:regulator of nonsense transcripts 1